MDHPLYHCTTLLLQRGGPGVRQRALGQEERGAWLAFFSLPLAMAQMANARTDGLWASLTVPYTAYVLNSLLRNTVPCVPEQRI